MQIRDAVPEDASAACEVLRRSISELCGADHQNDPVILGRWLANKTPETVATWIRKPGNSVLVAVESDTILAVGCLTDAGEITLNYVSPDARFRGISRALLVALETRAQERGTSDAPFSVPKRLIASTGPQGTLRMVHPKESLARLRATRCRSA